MVRKLAEIEMSHHQNHEHILHGAAPLWDTEDLNTVSLAAATRGFSFVSVLSYQPQT